MTPVGATARRRVWSDVPLVKNLLLGAGLVGAVAGFAMRWGPLPAQVQQNSERLSLVERDVRSLLRGQAFDTCRWQDSTITQCIHHLKSP
jgi:hypothetical protein